MRRSAAIAFGSVLALAAPGRAEVKQKSAASMVAEHNLASTANPADVYRAIAQVDHWWNSTHTLSGNAANLTLKPEAGGCFCEKWSDGSVEHGRVVQTQRDRLVVLDAKLGPLLSLAVSGVLTFSLKPQGNGTVLLVIYRISGDPTHNLIALAPVVDKVLGEQARRLLRFAETGKPE
jgi:uncharacterized protein YndB with AHSA1/START domain